MLTVGNYHYIRNEYRTKFPSIFGVTPTSFRKQLILLKEKGDFISINDLNSDFNSILSDKENYHMITFDDGLMEQYKFGLEIMDELKIEGYFFVNSLNFEKNIVSTVHKIHLIRSLVNPSKLLKKFLFDLGRKLSNQEQKRASEIYRFDKIVDAQLKYTLNFLFLLEEKEKSINNLFENYFDEEETLNELYMSKNQLINLSEKGFLGNHSYSHYPLGLINESNLSFEINQSKKYLEDLTKNQINAISYPYGTEESFSGNVLREVKNSGHIFGFTTLKGKNTINDDLLTLKRFDCNDLIGGKNYES